MSKQTLKKSVKKQYRIINHTTGHGEIFAMHLLFDLIKHQSFSVALGLLGAFSENWMCRFHGGVLCTYL